MAWAVRAELRADLKIAACGKRCQRCAGMGFPAQLTQDVPPYRLLKYPPDFVLFALCVAGQSAGMPDLPLDTVPEMGTVTLAMTEMIWLVTFCLAGCKFVILSVPGHGLLLSGVARHMKSNSIKYTCKKWYKPIILGVTCCCLLAPF